MNFWWLEDVLQWHLMRVFVCVCSKNIPQTASSIHRPISLSLSKMMKNEVQTLNQAFHTFRHFWPVCFHSWGKKTVVDMMKRGSTFGELAIIFLIPRKPGSEKTSVLNLWAPWTLVLWDCIFTIFNQVKVGYGLHIPAGCTVAAVALQVIRCSVYCSVRNKFPMTSCKLQIAWPKQPRRATIVCTTEASVWVLDRSLAAYGSHVTRYLPVL